MMIHNTRPSGPSSGRRFKASAQRPLALLKQCPVYQKTPLHNLSDLAKQLGVESFQVKDETNRMRLGSFKALGGIYAIAQLLQDATSETDLLGEKTRQVASELTFITASAGNHGLSIAAGASIFGSNAVIVLSAAVPEAFAVRIRSMGAQIERVTGSYEDSVQQAVNLAEENNWLHLADGSWDGYTERPALVMEGYSVLAEESRQEFEQSGLWPSHVFLQAGVGGLAASVAAHIREHWAKQPTITIVEPDAAPCLGSSIEAGHLVQVAGPVSHMGRLDCKDASLIAFESLKLDAEIFMAVTDAQAQAATGLLAKHNISTTSSGAAPLAGALATKLPPDARCLMIATEGPEIKSAI